MAASIPQHAAPVASIALPHLYTGVSIMTALISTAVGVIVAGVVGYFVGKRGLTGTKSDLSNVVKTVENPSAAVQSVTAKL